MNIDGLKDSVVEMIAGAKIPVQTGTFSNDMTTFSTKDDVLTLLVHLGYLTYDSEQGTVAIPNKEVSQEYINALSTMDWHEVMASVKTSKELLEALWNMDAEAVAEGIEQAHKEISVLQYNDENSLSSVLSIAYLGAMQYYFKPVRELPTGKGFADFVFIPKPEHSLNYPAMVVELKWDKKVETAIKQIKDKNYSDTVKQYNGDILLVGISYDKKTKKHECVIEKYPLDK